VNSINKSFYPLTGNKVQYIDVRFIP